ncbi:MAG: hypothetical protein ACSLFN_15700 [Candidatus Limnocylindrales bacterium]
MDLTPVVGGIVVVNLTVLLAGCTLAAIRTFREHRRAAPLSSRFGPPVGASPRRTRPAGRGST